MKLVNEALEPIAQGMQAMFAAHNMDARGMVANILNKPSNGN